MVLMATCLPLKEIDLRSNRSGTTTRTIDGQWPSKPLGRGQYPGGLRVMSVRDARVASDYQDWDRLLDCLL